MKRTILVVDDEPAILSSLSGVLKDEGYHLSVAKSGEEAIQSVLSSLPELVLLDIWMPGMDGIETLKKMKEINGDFPVIVMSGHGSVETAVKAIKVGAYDYVEKPLSLEKVVLLVRHALNEQRLTHENRALRGKVSERYEMVGESPVIKQLREQIKKAAPAQSRIFISGENGTGKELVARAIYAQSPRLSGPFVDVNCAAIPESLIESELFGYEKGAFTGAERQKRGQFEHADGGTLFLDEIGDMLPATQAKVLRVLQESAFYRVGGTVPVQVDVRVIAASNKNLEEEVKKGTFREDLYYRLNVIPLRVPPLRDRLEDIPLLAAHFIKEISEEHGIKPKEITSDAMDLLKRYSWPGNVPDPVVFPKDISPFFIGNENKSPAHPVFDSLKEARTQFEREFILGKLSLHGWNISETAEDLKIERTHLYRKMKLLNIVSP